MPRRDYQAGLDADNRRAAESSLSARDIASDYPEPGNLLIREACRVELRRFCESYFPEAFSLPWSDDHLRAINRMERVILGGGLFALAMPRGSGKSTLTVRAAIWALLYGHRRFVSLVCATEELARRLLKQLKSELAFNDALARDFREVCHPIRRLENNARRCIGQLFRGRQTLVDWSDDRVTLPTMPDDACDGVNVSGSTVTVSGLTGALRGQSHTLPTGVVIRPELVILDDPQTRESAMSPSQSASRAAIIKGDVLGMAGPGREIAAIMPCTVIRDGDLAAELLDRQKSPEWGGQRTKMVYAFPANLALWEEYGRILHDSMRADGDGSEATEFYRANREAMDAGSAVAWPARFGARELSAIQHAMNLRLRDERAFFAEYQNEPLPEIDSRPDDLVADHVAARVNRQPRGTVPPGCTRLTAFVDVQANVLFWLVCGWEDDFTGAVLDYGTFPDQKRPYFSLRDCKHTLSQVVKGAGLEGRIYGGLEKLAASVLGREWPSDDGSVMRVERCLVDANWGDSTEVVRRFCRQSAFAGILMPSHGKFLGASSNPMSEWPKQAGERRGGAWRVRTKDRVRSVIYDTNYWKSFVAHRLSVPMGDRGALTLFGDKPESHRLLSDHLTSEFRVRVEGRGRVVDEWKQRPDRPDNHWFDCLVGAAVAASIQGATLPEAALATERRQRVSFRAAQESKRRDQVVAAPKGRVSFREMQKARA
jgi:hypothetical protein